MLQPWNLEKTGKKPEFSPRNFREFPGKFPRGFSGKLSGSVRKSPKFSPEICGENTRFQSGFWRKVPHFSGKVPGEFLVVSLRTVGRKSFPQFSGKISCRKFFRNFPKKFLSKFFRKFPEIYRKSFTEKVSPNFLKTFWFCLLINKTYITPRIIVTYCLLLKKSLGNSTYVTHMNISSTQQIMRRLATAVGHIRNVTLWLSYGNRRINVYYQHHQHKFIRMLLTHTERLSVYFEFFITCCTCL